MKILQAHADRDTGVVTYYAHEGENVRKRQVAGEFISYFRHADVSRDLMRTLRSSSHVRGVSQEGDWIRVWWATNAAREAACNPKDGWFSKQGIDTLSTRLHFGFCCCRCRLRRRRCCYFFGVAFVVLVVVTFGVVAGS
jgi:hypothetical protein